MTPTTSRRPRGRPVRSASEIEHKRTLIAEAAQKLFAEDGYRAVSIRRVAGAVGMTPMTLYSYFDSKIDLLRYLWSDVFGGLFDTLDLIADHEPDVRRRLSKVAYAYVRYWIDHPDHYRMVFMSEGVSQPDVSVFVANDPISERFDLFVRCVIAVTGADLKEAAPVAQLLICSLQGIAHCHVTISGYPWLAPDRLIETLLTSSFSV